MAPWIVWFRQDLRLADNPALQAAIDSGQPVLPIFIWAPHEEGRWPLGGASKWWLHHSLKSLSDSLQKCGTRLIIYNLTPQQSSLSLLEKVIKETGASHLSWNRRYEPDIIDRDKKIKERLTAQGVEVKSFKGSLLFEPWEVRTQQNKPYQVFTPFWRQCLNLPPPAKPFSQPKKINGIENKNKSDSLESLELLPKIKWADGFKNEWRPGEAGAKNELEKFLESRASTYPVSRDIPSQKGTSRLSPHLHFGEISPRQIWHKFHLQMALRKETGFLKGAENFLREIGWREFAYHLLYEFPETPQKPLREQFSKFPWNKNEKFLKAWQKGLTGYPIVDAGLRELWATGWMHNRVRMIVSSFLVKDLLISWREGADWFWDTLVDADLASNTLGWQWSAGCGADAAPYFRIFNPITQGEKFDPEGLYVRKWIPEISKCPNKFIHKPFEAPPAVLEQAQIILGKTYPAPLVDHAEAREKALFSLKVISQR